MTVTLVSDNSVPSSLCMRSCSRTYTSSDYAPTELPVWPVAQGPSSARALTTHCGLAGPFIRSPNVTLGLARGRKLLGALFGGEKGPDLTLAQGRLPRLAVGHVDARRNPYWLRARCRKPRRLRDFSRRTGCSRCNWPANRRRPSHGCFCRSRPRLSLGRRHFAPARRRYRPTSTGFRESLHRFEWIVVPS